MAEYGGWVTLGDESPKPPEKSRSWLKPIHLTKSELLHSRGNCSGLRGAEWLMAEYGGWVTLGDESPKPPAPNPLKKWQLDETNLPHQV